MTDSESDEARKWAKLIRDHAKDDDVIAIISAINQAQAQRGVKTASVLVACAQVLAQLIVTSGPESARELRLATSAIIDGYSTEVAVLRDAND